MIIDYHKNQDMQNFLHVQKIISCPFIIIPYFLPQPQETTDRILVPFVTLKTKKDTQSEYFT